MTISSSIALTHPTPRDLWDQLTELVVKDLLGLVGSAPSVN